MGAAAETTAALEDLVEALDKRGSPIRQQLRAGHPREQVRARLTAEGLDPLEDLVAWYAFADGTGVAEPHPLRVAWLIPHRLWLPLEDALADRRGALTLEAVRGEAASSYRQTDVTVLDGAPPQVVVDTAPGPEQGILRELWYDDPPAESTGMRLADCVAWVAHRLRTGAIVLDAWGGLWEGDVPATAGQVVAHAQFASGGDRLLPHHVEPVRNIAAMACAWDADVVVERLPNGVLGVGEDGEARQAGIVAELLLDAGVPPGRITIQVVPPALDPRTPRVTLRLQKPLP